MHTSGIGLMFFLEISLSIHPMVPSPPATKMRHGADRILLIKLSASFGPDELNSNIWMGFKTLRKTAITLSAVLSPDLLLAIWEMRKIHFSWTRVCFSQYEKLTNNNQWFPVGPIRFNDFNGLLMQAPLPYEYMVRRNDYIFKNSKITDFLISGSRKTIDMGAALTPTTTVPKQSGTTMIINSAFTNTTIVGLR